MSDGGCVVTSLAMLLRHHNVITDSNVNSFNPWICNEDLKRVGAFDSNADLSWASVTKAYPGFELVDYRTPYSFSTIERLYREGYACIINVGGHYVALKDVTGTTVNIMDPGYSNRPTLASYSNPKEIIYYKVTPAKTELKTGDIIEFGSYPQAEEKDPAIIVALNSLAPEWNKWTSYGYYSGDGNIGSMKQGDWMRYVDVPYGGATYRGVKFTEYRPFHTWKVVSESNTYQSANGYKTNTIYWFKFEPIKWKVLDPNTGLVLSELLIDSQAFNNEIYGNGNIYSTHYGDAEKKNKANKYETSSIRAWLNYDFYNTAFSDAEELKMLPYGNVADRVVLLSTSEVANSKYGFNVDGGAYDEARKGIGSDYAKSQGLYLYENGTNKGNSYWILRTAGDYSVHCKEVTYSCNITNDFGWNVATTNNGIRPAIVLKTLDVNAPCQHPNATNVPQLDPNCIDIGFTAGTYCNDCATWLSGHEVIAVGDHKDSNGDRICDTCLVELSKPGGTEVVKKNFIQKAIDAVKNAINGVVNFFRRLLGI